MTKEKKDNFFSCSNVSFDWLSKDIKSFSTLDNINFSINEGEFVGIIGSSGCGKSTLISLLSGTRQASSGEIIFDGNLLTKPSSKIGIVFQDYSLFPWLNIKNNIKFGMNR